MPSWGPTRPVEKFTESFKGRRQPKLLFEIKKSKSREGEQLHTENYAKVKNFFLDFVSRSGLCFCLCKYFCLLCESILTKSHLNPVIQPCLCDYLLNKKDLRFVASWINFCLRYCYVLYSTLAPYGDAQVSAQKRGQQLKNTNIDASTL